MVIAFENELNRAINPQLLRVTPGGAPLAWETIRRQVEANEPLWRLQRIYMPATASDSTYVRLVSRGSAETREIYVNQYTGRVLGRKELAHQLVWKMHEWHINLGAGLWGSRLVFYSSIGLLGLALSGLVLWLSPAFSNSRSNSCCFLFRFTGVSTIAWMYMSPRTGERNTVIPLPRNRN